MDKKGPAMPVEMPSIAQRVNISTVHKLKVFHWLGSHGSLRMGFLTGAAEANKILNDRDGLSRLGLGNQLGSTTYHLLLLFNYHRKIEEQ